MYVENSLPKIKNFPSKEAMHKFVKRFQKKYPDYLAYDSGYWIDYCVLDVHGDVHFFTDGLIVE